MFGYIIWDWTNVALYSFCHLDAVGKPFELDGLRYYTTYLVSVAAINGAGEGIHAEANITTGTTCKKWIGGGCVSGENRFLYDVVWCAKTMHFRSCCHFQQWSRLHNWHHVEGKSWIMQESVGLVGQTNLLRLSPVRQCTCICKVKIPLLRTAIIQIKVAARQKQKGRGGGSGRKQTLSAINFTCTLLLAGGNLSIAIS